jgi:hypothetical protein
MKVQRYWAALRCKCGAVVWEHEVSGTEQDKTLALLEMHGLRVECWKCGGVDSKQEIKLIEREE